MLLDCQDSQSNTENDLNHNTQHFCVLASKREIGFKYTQRGNKLNFWQPQVATWGYSHSTPSGLRVLRYLSEICHLAMGKRYS